LLKLGVGKSGAEVISAKGAGKAVDGGLEEEGGMRKVWEDMEFIPKILMGRQEGQYCS